jgi:hypothetical protein
MPIPKEQLGDIETITTLAGDSIDVQYVVIDVTALVASNHLNGAINESFPQSLQPRNRTTSEAVKKLAQHSLTIDFHKLNKSKRTDIGAPIVGDDLVVESGNGRVLALTKAYYEGHAYEYRYLLNSLAERFGIPKGVVESMNWPILARLRLTDVDRAKFARDSNIDNGQSQNEKLADNGRMFESIVTAAKERGNVSELKPAGRGLVGSIGFAISAVQIKESLMSYAGSLALSSADNSVSMYASFVATKLERYLTSAIQVTGSMLINVVNPKYELGVARAEFHIGSDAVVAAAIGRALALSEPMDYETFIELFNSTELIQGNYSRQTIQNVIDGNAHSSVAVSVAGDLMPLEAVAEGDKALMAKILTLVTGVDIYGRQLEVLQTPPKYSDSIIENNPELFPESVVSFIESLYSDIPATIDTDAVLDTFNHITVAESDSLKAEIKASPSDKEKLIANSIVWARFGAARNESINAFNASKASKSFKEKRLAEIRDRDKHLKDINAPEHDEYFKAITDYRLLGKKPTAKVFSINGLARLLAAENLSKNEQSKAAVHKVDGFIAAQIQGNRALPEFVAAHDAKSLKGKISRYNNSDKHAGVIESLPNILAYSDALNRLLGGNLSKSISFDFTGYRANFGNTGSSGGGVVNVGSGSLATMWHELGHSLEYRFPALKKLAVDLLINRYNSASIPKVLPITEVLTDFGTKRTEELVVNNYTFSVYAMRIYPSVYRLASAINVKDLSTLDASEVISTAMELLASPKGIAKLMSDKEHFSIAMAIVEYLKEKRD